MFRNRTENTNTIAVLFIDHFKNNRAKKNIVLLQIAAKNKHTLIDHKYTIKV